MTGIKVQYNSKTDNSFDMTKLVIRLIATCKGLNLSETEVLALTYFVVNGYNKMTREEIIQNKLLKSKASVANLLSSFRRYGIIEKTNLGESISKDFAIPNGNFDIIQFESRITK